MTDCTQHSRAKLLNSVDTSTSADGKVIFTLRQFSKELNCTKPALIRFTF